MADKGVYPPLSSLATMGFECYFVVNYISQSKNFRDLVL